MLETPHLYCMYCICTEQGLDEEHAAHRQDSDMVHASTKDCDLFLQSETGASSLCVGNVAFSDKLSHIIAALCQISQQHSQHCIICLLQNHDYIIIMIDN